MKKFFIALMLTGLFFPVISNAQQPTCQIQLDASNSCFGQSNGSIVTQILGNQAGYSFFWNDGATTRNRSGLAPGNYCLFVTNSISGCSSELFCVTVGTNPTPVTFSVTGGGSYCQGGQGMPITLLGSQLGVTYQLFLNGVSIAGLQGNGGQLFFGMQTQPGNYFVTATNANGCVSQMAGFTTITVNPLPTIMATVSPNAICLGDTSTLFTTVNGITTQMDVIPCTTTIYNPSVTINGCTATAAATLYVTDCNPDSDGDGTPDVSDCAPNDAAIHPGATEICDGVDNDCDGQIDEGVLNTYYRDMDADTYGNPAVIQQACSQPIGYVANNSDCNDNSTLQHPGQVWYADLDSDGYSNGTTLTQCLRPAGYKAAIELTATTGDCNDNNAAIKPGVTEICDGVDNNCNGQVDEGLTPNIPQFSYSTGDDEYFFFSVDNVQVGVSYVWNFGDGASGNGTGVGHTYTTSGTFTVTLTATNNCGTSTWTVTVNVCIPVVILYQPQDTVTVYVLTTDILTLSVVVQGSGHSIIWQPYAAFGCQSCWNYSFAVSNLGLGTHHFAWIVDAGTSCPVSGTVVVKVLPGSGVTGTSEQGLESIDIFPNPTTGEVNVIGVNTETSVNIFNV